MNNKDTEYDNKNWIFLTTEADGGCFEYSVKSLTPPNEHHGPQSFLKRSFTDAQEIRRILWNHKIHHRFHNSPPSVPVLNQINLVLAPSDFLRVHFNINLPSTPRPVKCFVIQRQNLIWPSFSHIGVRV
jgi:hypothetical protein